MSFTDSLGQQRSEGNTNFSFEPQITHANREPSPDFIEINTQIEQLREQSSALEERRKQSLEKIAKKERKKKRKEKREKKTNRVTFSDSSEYNSTGMSEIEEVNGAGEDSQTPIISSEMLPSEKVLEEEAEERRLEEEKKKNREPPIVFKDIDVSLTHSRMSVAWLTNLISAKIRARRVSQACWRQFVRGWAAGIRRTSPVPALRRRMLGFERPLLGFRWTNPQRRQRVYRSQSPSFAIARLRRLERRHYSAFAPGQTRPRLDELLVRHREDQAGRTTGHRSLCKISWKFWFSKIIFIFFRRHATCLRTQTHRNGFCTSANGRSTVNRHQTSAQPQKSWCTRCCHRAQSSRSSDPLWLTTWASRK